MNSHTHDHNIAAMAYNKMQIDPLLPGHTRASLGSQEIADKIAETIKKLPVAAAHIQRVLKDEKITLMCTTGELIRKRVNSMATNVSACFGPLEKTLFLTKETLTPSLIIHEFRHADAFIHNEQRHIQNPIDALFPVYPSKENIEKYKTYLDEGDKNIREYKNLWEKNKLGRALSKEERQKLQNFEDAATDCLPPLIYDINPLELFDNLEKLGIKSGSVVTKQLESRKILSIEKMPNHTLIIMQPNEPAQYIFHILKEIEEKLEKSEAYRNKSKMEKLIERDAYTFQYLSENARNTFYESASKMYEQDKIDCASLTIFSRTTKEPFKFFKDYNLDGSISKYEQALRKAACNNRVDDLIAILNGCPGININAQDKNPKTLKTSLHWAAEKGNIECMKILLEQGALTDIKDANEETVLDYATRANNQAIKDIISQHEKLKKKI